METVIFAANLLYLASYFMRDLLRLRLLTVVAAGLVVVYFCLQAEPLWAVIGWNLFFIALNLVQAGRELRARWLARRPDAAVPDCAGIGAAC